MGLVNGNVCTVCFEIYNPCEMYDRMIVFVRSERLGGGHRMSSNTAPNGTEESLCEESTAWTWLSRVLGCFAYHRICAVLMLTTPEAQDAG